MDEKALELLEFRKVQEMLAKEASTPLGRDAALKVTPGSVALAIHSQALGREIVRALSSLTSPGLYGVTDIRRKVQRARQGITLSPVDILEILNVLGAFDSLMKWLDQLDSAYPRLLGLKGRIPAIPGVKKRLGEVVDSEGAIKDSASPALSSIRRSLREYQDKIRKRAEEITRRRDIAEVLQEPIVTIRNGRFVIPVKQEYAQRVQGLIHDQSASGQTVFIEPVEILEMSNNLRRLELMERDEIERILIEVSGIIGANAESLDEGVDALGEFDLALAKARLLQRWKGSFPQVSERHVLSLKRAWHPLLKGSPVPMDISLDENGVRTIVITGPNMGGKTVALKTCGLIAAMALSGMPCPCQDETVVGDISDILCDIGDEQSIEENLSTFSAHISNVTRILRAAGPGKLVLIDELGAGTDPHEGSALALAVLGRLNAKKAMCVITSHYSELKLMAQEREGMQNASVEWDAVRLVPTYRLLVGVPGRSNAFLVAARLGLDPDVLEDARSNMREEMVKLDDVIQELEESSQKARNEAEAAVREHARAEALRREYESKVMSIEQSRANVLSQARAEAQVIVSRARVEFEKALREIREEAKKGQGNLNSAVTAIRERLAGIRNDLESPKTVSSKAGAGQPLAPSDVQVGLEVAVAGLGEKGIIIEPLDQNGSVMVRVGSFTMRVDLSDLRLFREGANGHSDGPRDGRVRDPRGQQISVDKALSIASEIDLRGMTREEAYAALDKYLDDAALASLNQVRIIHGKGTGALRKAVSEYLATHPAILEQRIGQIAEGGAGVTVARLRV